MLERGFMHCMVFISFVLLLVFSGKVSAQDERYMRRLFAGDLTRKPIPGAGTVYKWKVQTPLIRMDITGDVYKESILVEKRDGENWIHIHDRYNKRKGIFRLTTNGARGRLYKINLRQLSPTTNVLLLYFFEGKVEYIKYRASARIYMVTIDNGDMNTLSMFKGPVFWDERRDGHQHYHQRQYHISLFDFNDDGIKELVVKYRKSSLVYMYEGMGKWAQFVK